MESVTRGAEEPTEQLAFLPLDPIIHLQNRPLARLLADRYGECFETWHRRVLEWRRAGALTLWQADELATALGSHPATLWGPDWANAPVWSHLLTAAATIGLHEATIRSWIRKGRLECRRDATGFRLVNIDDVQAIWDEHLAVRRRVELRRQRIEERRAARLKTKLEQPNVVPRYNHAELGHDRTCHYCRRFLPATAFQRPRGHQCKECFSRRQRRSQNLKYAIDPQYRTRKLERSRSWRLEKQAS